MMPSEATVQLSRSDYCHLTGTNCTEYPVTQLTETHAAGLCVSVCACRRHSASPECWEVRDYDSSDSVDLVGWGWGWHMLTLRKRMENTDTEELNKYKRLTDLLICPFFFFSTVGLSITSCSFHVSMSHCLCVPEMTTSQTLWVRRLTARPAVAMLGRINAQEKTSVHPMTPGSLKPSSPGGYTAVKQC